MLVTKSVSRQDWKQIKISWEQLKNKKKTIKTKSRIFFQDKLQANSKNSKELWKTLKSLGLKSKKTSQSKIGLIGDEITQFEPKKMQIFLKLSILSWQETYSKNKTSSQI